MPRWRRRPVASGVDTGEAGPPWPNTLSSPPSWVPALLVASVYVLWMALFVAGGHDMRDLIRIGARNIHTSTASAALRPDPTYRYEPPQRDYDGQYYYFIAADPLNARYYLDSPTYRYTRIVYPLMARVLALGQTAAIPYTMALVNILALALSTLLLAVWLRRRRLSGWLALVLGFYAGSFVAFTRDVAEPLAVMFVILGIVLLDRTDRRSVLLAGAAFGLAALTRETLAVFPVVYGLIWPPPLVAAQNLFARRHRLVVSATLLGLGLVPLLVYKAFLIRWLGTSDATTVLFADLHPFHGILVYYPWDATRLTEVLFVVLPSLACGAVALRALLSDWRRPEPWCVLANVAAFVVFLNSASYFNYTASGRIAVGVVLAALLTLPAADASARRAPRAWLWLCAPLWVLLTPLLYVTYLAPGAVLR